MKIIKKKGKKVIYEINEVDDYDIKTLLLDLNKNIYNSFDYEYYLNIYLKPKL